jgi:hypothetical protein
LHYDLHNYKQTQAYQAKEKEIKLFPLDVLCNPSKCDADAKTAYIGCYC